jgi:O-antigen/teichoic acid export membrane protein
MVDFSKKSSWIFLHSVITSAGSLILVLLYANYLEPSIFGTFKFLLSLFTVFSAVSLTGLGIAAVREFSRNKENRLPDLYRTNLKWSVVIFIATIICSIYYYIQGNSTLGSGVLIGGLLYPFIQSFLLYESYLIGRQHIRQQSILSICKYAVVTGVLIITVLLSDNAVLIIATYSIAQLISAGSIYYIVSRQYPSSEKITPETLTYSKHLSGMSILTRIANHADQILLFHFLGAAQLAIYVIALTIPQNLKGTFFGLKNIVMPKLASKELADIKKTVPHKAVLFFIVLFVVASLYSILSPFLFIYLLPGYIAAIPYTQALAFTIVFTATMPLRQTFLAHARKKELYISQITVPMLKIILGIVLIPLYGIWGAVIALLTTRAYSSLLYIFLFIRLK